MEGITWNAENLSTIGKVENILDTPKIFKGTLFQQYYKRQIFVFKIIL